MSGTVAVFSRSSFGDCDCGLHSRELRHDGTADDCASILSGKPVFDDGSLAVLLAGTGSRGAKFPRGRLVISGAIEGIGAFAVLERHAVRAVSDLPMLEALGRCEAFEDEDELEGAFKAAALPGTPLLRASSASLARAGR